MKSVWDSLKKPIFALAPMEDATDTVFRQIISSLGAPDIYFTEFTSVEGLMSQNGHKIVSKRLIHTEKEHPIIAQIWGINPVNFKKSAQIITKMGFDGIDLNMGCPEKKIIKIGACSALIKNKPLAQKIINETKKGAGTLPISIKTRLGFSKIDMSWIEFLLEQNISALTIHLRTVKEMSDVPAHWEEIAKIIKLRNKISPKTLILGNGDIKSLEEARKMVDKHKIDGVMIGRGVFHNPWVFNKNGKKTDSKKRIEVLEKHINLFEKTYGKSKNYATLKKYFKIYISNFDGSSELRSKLMQTRSPKEALLLLNTYIS